MTKAAQKPRQHHTRTGIGLSDLSVTEFITLERMGYLPHGLVVGCAVFDAGGPMSSLYTISNPAATIAQAMHTARARAVARMRDQARQLRAEGVVGVRLSVEHHRWRGGHLLARFLAVGTAIGFDPAHAPHDIAHAPPLRLHDDGPFTSDLSGQDFVTLLHAGFRPITLAMGNSAVQVNSSLFDSLFSSFSNITGNYELATYTRAFFDAREQAMENMDRDLFADFPVGHADMPCGIVGMTVDEKAHQDYGQIVEFTAIGTAIAELHPDDPRITKKGMTPLLVVPLDR